MMTADQEEIKEQNKICVWNFSHFCDIVATQGKYGML